MQDQRLSLRHLAWNGGTLGVAMQAEHERTDDREAGHRIPPRRPPALGGYGGDIARHGEGFAGSAPRSDTVALFAGSVHPLGRRPLAEVCPVVDIDGELLAAGANGPSSLAQTAGDLVVSVGSTTTGYLPMRNRPHRNDTLPGFAGVLDARGPR